MTEPWSDSPTTSSKAQSDKIMEEWTAVFAARAAEWAADLSEAEVHATTLRMTGDRGGAVTRRAKSFVLRHPRLKSLALKVRRVLS